MKKIKLVEVEKNFFINRMKIRTEDYETKEDGRIYKNGKFTNIRYTENDFFRVELEDMDRVRDFVNYNKETLKDYESAQFRPYIDESGFPIFSQIDSAEMFIDLYKKTYKDQWKNDFIYGEGTRDEQRFLMWRKYGKKNEFKDLKNKASLLFARKMFEEKCEGYSDYRDKCINEIDELLSTIDKEQTFVEKEKKKYIKSFITEVKLQKVDKKDLYKLCVNDIKDLREPFKGVYYDSEGFAVATEGHAVVSSRLCYEKGKDGKIIDKNGNEINARFPSWRSVIPGDEKLELTSISVDDLFIRLIKFRKWCDFFGAKDYQRTFHIIYGDNVLGYNADILYKFLLMAILHEDSKIYLDKDFIGETAKRMMFKSKDGSSGLVMPLHIDDPQERIRQLEKYGCEIDVDYGYCKMFGCYFHDSTETPTQASKYKDNDALRKRKIMIKAKALRIRQMQMDSENKSLNGINYIMY